MSDGINILLTVRNFLQREGNWAAQSCRIGKNGLRNLENLGAVGFCLIRFDCSAKLSPANLNHHDLHHRAAWFKSGL